jgi:deoxycytidylate deaminase
VESGQHSPTNTPRTPLTQNGAQANKHVATLPTTRAALNKKKTIIKATKILNLAERAATRSPLPRFQTGCVIVNRDELVTLGWSHTSSVKLACYRSVHAELHALGRCDQRALKGATISIVTLSRKSGNRTDAMPCLHCMRNIVRVGINKIIIPGPNNTTEIIYPQDLEIDELEDGMGTGRQRNYFGAAFRETLADTNSRVAA